MTTPPVFPTLPGISWSVRKKPVFSTRIAPHVSGREVRLGMYSSPIWEFEVAFDGLDSSAAGSYPGLGSQSLQSLMGFFLQVYGQYQTFLWIDPTDSVATGQVIGVGDGATTFFSIVRTLGGFVEPVGWVTTLNHVYLNGALQSSGFSLVAPNKLSFSSAPGSSVVVSADFVYAFQCRFAADEQDFEQSMQHLWEARGLKFRSVRSA